jgi:hypothetical protein
VRPGAPAFYYEGAVYDPRPIYAPPPWHQPWVWVDDHWLYRPYRYWYWNHPARWRPGWREGARTYGYRRW